MGWYARSVNRFSATRAGSWLVRNFAAKVDPLIWRWSKGRFTSTGVPTLPMLSLTVVGRKSGEPRTVQLAYHRDGDHHRGRRAHALQAARQTQDHDAGCEQAQQRGDHVQHDAGHQGTATAE